MAAEIIHENTLFAEPVAHLGHFVVTNSILTAGLALVIIILVSVRHSFEKVPQVCRML
jgi:hypothetical protein